MPVVINGTTGITNVNGSAAAPAETGIDTDTGIYYGTNTVGLATNGTNALFVDASQNVGVGTSSPASKLHVAGSFRQTGATAPFEWTVNPGAADYLKLNAVGYADNLIVANSIGNVGIGTTSPARRLDVSASSSAGSADIGITNTQSSTLATVATTGTTYSFSGVGGSTSWFYGSKTVALGTDSANPIQFITNAGEKARIDSSGNLLVGTTSTLNNATVCVVSGSGVGLVVRNSTATAGKFWNTPYVNGSNTLYVINQTNTGVYLTDGSTAWAANSDERLKTDLKPIENAAAKVATLRAVTGRFKTDEEGTSRAFLIAQDVQAVLPEAVDATDPERLGVAYTDTIPLLVAAIKELKTQNDDLRARVAALEGVA